MIPIRPNYISLENLLVAVFCDVGNTVGKGFFRHQKYSSIARLAKAHCVFQLLKTGNLTWLCVVCFVILCLSSFCFIITNFCFGVLLGILVELWLCQHHVCLPQREEPQYAKWLLAVIYCWRSHVVQCKQRSTLCMPPAPELLLLVLCVCGQIAAWGVRKSNASVQFICSAQPEAPTDVRSTSVLLIPKMIASLQKTIKKKTRECPQFAYDFIVLRQ